MEVQWGGGAHPSLLSGPWAEICRTNKSKWGEWWDIHTMDNSYHEKSKRKGPASGRKEVSQSRKKVDVPEDREVKSWWWCKMRLEGKAEARLFRPYVPHGRIVDFLPRTLVQVTEGVVCTVRKCPKMPNPTGHLWWYYAQEIQINNGVTTVEGSIQPRWNYFQLSD